MLGIALNNFQTLEQNEITESLSTSIWKNSDTYSFDFINYFNELGEWEFYLEAEYETFGTQTIATTVFCEYMKSKKTYTFDTSKSLRTSPSTMAASEGARQSARAFLP